MLNAIVYVLISIHTVWPAHHPDRAYRVKEYQSTFARQDTCTRIMEEMNRASADYSWYCERHIVE